jgi:hypothetical protein
LQDLTADKTYWIDLGKFQSPLSVLRTFLRGKKRLCIQTATLHQSGPEKKVAAINYAKYFKHLN